MSVTGTGNQGLIPEREPEKRLPLLREAAGAQITQYQIGEVVTLHNKNSIDKMKFIGMGTV